MNRRLPSIFDELFPDSLPEFAAIADAWPQHTVVSILTLVWEAFDRLKALPAFGALDFSKDYVQLERSLTQLHALQVTRLYAEQRSGFESFIPQHEPWEFEGLGDRRARPRSCDIGFVLSANPRLWWCVEAKVLSVPTETRRYIDDLQKYLSGASAPYATESALAAYLTSGKPEELFDALASQLQLQFARYGPLAVRPHRITQHERERSTLPAAASTHFVCHHLVFSLS